MCFRERESECDNSSTDIMIISCHNIYRRGYIVERADSPCKLVIYFVPQYEAKILLNEFIRFGKHN